MLTCAKGYARVGERGRTGGGLHVADRTALASASQPPQQEARRARRAALAASLVHWAKE